MSAFGRPDRTAAVYPLAFTLCWLVESLYGGLVYYPAFVALHTRWNQAVGSHVELLRSYQKPLVLMVGLALTTTILLLLAINAAFRVGLKGTKFLAQFKIFLLVLVALPGIALPPKALIVMLRASSHGTGYLWQPQPLVDPIESLSLAAVLAITAVSFSSASLGWKRKTVNAHVLALAALICAQSQERLGWAYLAPLCVAASWVLVALWVWEEGATDVPREASTNPATP